MKKYLQLFLFFSLAILANANAQTPWKFPLYVDGGIPHSQRVKVDIENTGTADIDGEHIRLSASALGIAAQDSKSIRIVAQNGRELLYISSKNSGALAEDSIISIPINCAAKSKTFVWVYSNNSSAWELPESRPSFGINLSESFEDATAAESENPQGWYRSSIDATHTAAWCKDVARSGSRSLRTAIVGTSTQTWVSFVRRFSVPEGTRYKISGWVKGENVAQRAGYYIHLGSPDNGVHKDSNSGTFDWRQVVFEGTTPAGTNYIQFGTVLYSTTGTAWFDDCTITIDSVIANVNCTIGTPEKLNIRTIDAPKNWECDKSQFSSRLVCGAFNLTALDSSSAICSVPVARVANGYFNAEDYKVFVDGTDTPFLLIGETLIFSVRNIPAFSQKRSNIYLRRERKNIKVDATLAQSSNILSDYEIASELPSNLENYENLMNSSVNLIKNYSFEYQSNWTYNSDGKKVVARYTSDAAKFGSQCAELDFGGTKGGWYGFRQSVAAENGKNYLLMGWTRAVDGDTGGRVYVHCTIGDGNFTNYDSVISSSKEWRMFIINDIKVVQNNSNIEVHCTSTAGHWQYDGFMLAQTLPVGNFAFESASDYYGNTTALSGELVTWQVPSVVKVFQSTEFDGNETLHLDVAANESENMQIAVRSGNGAQGVKVDATAAILYNEKGEKTASLPLPQIGVVGYVKIDAKSTYYSFTNYKDYECCAPNSAMGVMYPDPILPISTFDLKPAETTAVHLTFKTPKNAATGVYKGFVNFSIGGKVVRAVPYSVNVWDFALADEAPISAVFDYRTSSGSQYKNFSKRQVAEFLSERKLSVDQIPVAPSFWVDGNGNVQANFATFETEAKYYIETLKFKRLYLSGTYMFGWGLPPKNCLGAEPYVGTYPYDNVDRSQLNPTYKARMQGILRLTMNFLRSKGWDENFINYISDEPFYSESRIITQMKALCDLVHEVEPDLKIYVSTWYYIPEWKGKIDLWGVGAQGQASESEISEINTDGQIITTTDGQMCLDTPYNAIERLLPLYCFKYGFKGYEFWGADWYTLDPLEWGTHKVISQTDTPGVVKRVRYPNGDGYIFYSGLKYNQTKPIPSVRSEALRDGVEDYEYYAMLESLCTQTNDADATALLKKIKDYVKIPNAGGRNSTYLMPDPSEFIALRKSAGDAITRLKKSLRGELGFSAWAAANMPAADAAAKSPTACPYSDGFSNLEKYAFGISPNTAAVGADRAIFKKLSERQLAVKARVKSNISIETSDDMKIWRKAENVKVDVIDDQFNNYKFDIPANAAKQFYRINITEN